MATNKIKQLDELIKPILGSDKIYVDHTEKSLTEPGENYGSLMLAVEIKIKNKRRNDAEEIIHAVAKLIPPNEFLQKAFNVNVTFRCEVEFYRDIVPELQKFQREQGVKNVIDCFPKYYGSRINLSPEKDTVDENTVLLLENLILGGGYQMGDRFTGFDLQATEFVLRDLARFHAVPIAIKLLKPDVFNTKIKPYLRKKTSPPVDEAGRGELIDRNYATIKDDESFKHLLPKIRDLQEKCFNAIFITSDTVAEPFGTIIHFDFWLNNTMVKIVDNKVVSNKMVDFQLYEYGSPARDVIFFLYSSVRMDVIETYYDHFIDIYYRALVATLAEVKCDTTQFTREAFEQELQEARETEFCHSLGMTNPILTEKGLINEVHEITKDDFFATPITDKIRTKCSFIVKEFAKRKWI